MAADLAGLQDRLEPFSYPEVEDAVAAEFDQDIGTLFSSFEEEPVAAASIAQVHFATTDDGCEVAVKVLRPGIEEQFARDLESFDWAAGLVERWVKSLRRLRLRKIVGILARSVAVEMDLRMEAAAASELAENMQDEANYRVPKVHWEQTSRRILTIERVKGIPIADHDAIRTGSAAYAMTMGIVVVDRWTARATRPFNAMIRSGLRPTSSAASAGSRSFRPSACR